MKTPKSQYRPEIAPKFDAFDSTTERKLTGSAWFMAEPRDVAARTVPAPVTDCPLSTLVGELVSQVDAADPSQAGHAVRVAALATMLGSSIGMDAAELRQLRIAALLHDVGKILISTEILRKAGPLTIAEASTVRRHTVYGGTILRRIPVLAFAASTARWHHERWDGLGYPDGMVGNDIPLHARVVSVADALDAMTSARAYRPAISLEAAFFELEAQSGAQFDPLIVSAFGPLVGATGFRDSLDNLANKIEALPAAA
jgi:HD-GYP domain-containing protein (c-di-GMP phosphodiesterase class II)